MQNVQREITNTITGNELQVMYQPLRHNYQVDNSFNAFLFFKSIWASHTLYMQEQVYVLFLDKNCNVLCWRQLNTGTLTNCLIDIKLLAAMAAKLLADSVVVAHNHPSGNVAPSRQDVQMTENIREALYIVDCKLHDHLIITEDDYFSFVDNEGMQTDYYHSSLKMRNLKRRKKIFATQETV
ncbi:JAB domain-containing protein [Parasediminibacterium paludis]|uniref:JAB domain-containing protein n=1 Tax=Parasediminibacterium paludis TaxID=908966 RepID=A0ABV8PU33_9BACT